MAKVVKTTFQIFIYAFALIGFVLVGGFFAVRYGLTDVKGEQDINSNRYQDVSREASKIASSSKTTDIYQKEAEEKQLLCQIDIISYYAPANAATLLKVYENSLDRSLIIKMIFALNVRLSGRKNYENDIAKCSKKEDYDKISASQLKTRIKNQKEPINVFPWINTEDWEVVKKAITKDKDTIIKASNKAGIDPRIVVSVCIVEQLRLYNTQRELYEKVFKPLEILGNANKMAWGVMSIKESTAIKIENHLRDSNSDFYLGSKYQPLLDFSGDNPNDERYQRLTNEKDHSYSYLYGGLYINQIIHQWKKAGYDISSRPEITGTLFNLGFDKSQPKDNPVVGGSTVEINSIKYTFGSLSYEFFYSGEMMDDYPFITNTVENQI